MIKIETSRITTEDKSKENVEIYAEEVSASIKLFGLTIFKRHDEYKCNPLQTEPEKKIGFKK